MKKRYPLICSIIGIVTAITIFLSPISLLLSIIGLVKSSEDRKTYLDSFIISLIGSVVSIISLTILFCLFRLLIVFWLLKSPKC